MLTVHIISDSIGNTAKDVVDAALVQFSYGQVKYKVLKNSNVCTKEKIDSIILVFPFALFPTKTLSEGCTSIFIDK